MLFPQPIKSKEANEYWCGRYCNKFFDSSLDEELPWRYRTILLFLNDGVNMDKYIFLSSWLTISSVLLYFWSLRLNYLCPIIHSKVPNWFSLYLIRGGLTRELMRLSHWEGFFSAFWFELGAGLRYDITFIKVCRKYILVEEQISKRMINKLLSIQTDPNYYTHFLYL